MLHEIIERGVDVGKYLIKRVAYMLFSVFVISLITFVLVKSAPGNYLDTQRYVNQNLSDVTISPEVKAQWEKNYDLDKPEWYQYLKFTINAFTLHFGPSFQYQDRTIESIIAKALPISLSLAFAAIFVALLIGIPIGILAAVKKNSIIDRAAVFLSMIGTSIPSYVTAVFFMYLFGVVLHLVPTIGWGKPENYILPIISLAIGPVGSITRYIRSSIIDTLEKEYIKVAIAKGGGFKNVVLKHALKNSLIPLVTIIGPQIASLTVGTVFIESMFSVPGLGLYFSSAAIYRDYPMVMASTLFFAFIIMFTNLIVDLIYGVLDPRIRKNSMEGR